MLHSSFYVTIICAADYPDAPNLRVDRLSRMLHADDVNSVEDLHFVIKPYQDDSEGRDNLCEL